MTATIFTGATKEGNKMEDLTGKQFGELTVTGDRVPDKYGRKLWVCCCRCGGTTNAFSSDLVHGRVKSCGCLRRKASAERKRTHGGYGTRLYSIWKGMKERCFNANYRDYPHYGGRGITVCAEWAASFAAFRDWALANGYALTLTIERRNVNGNYEPGNCTWITLSEQQKNKTNSRRY